MVIEMWRCSPELPIVLGQLGVDVGQDLLGRAGGGRGGGRQQQQQQQHGGCAGVRALRLLAAGRPP